MHESSHWDHCTPPNPNPTDELQGPTTTVINVVEGGGGEGEGGEQRGEGGGIHNRFL